MELTERVLREHAGERIFDRGVGYVRYVHGLRAGATSARGSIQARRVYLVELDWSRADLTGYCTCPHAADGHFCKHLVAIGLAALDELTDPPDESMDEQLARLDAPVLRELLGELANRDPAVARLVAVRASAGRPDERVSTVLLAAVNEALDPPGFIDYRRSFDVGRDAETLLDELERHLDSGAADAARPALLRTMTELRTISEHADDSSGVLGSACNERPSSMPAPVGRARPTVWRWHAGWSTSWSPRRDGRRPRSRTTPPHSMTRPSPSTPTRWPRWTAATPKRTTGSAGGSTRCCSSWPITAATWTRRSRFSPAVNTAAMERWCTGCVAPAGTTR